MKQMFDHKMAFKTPFFKYFSYLKRLAAAFTPKNQTQNTVLKNFRLVNLLKRRCHYFFLNYATFPINSCCKFTFHIIVSKNPKNTVGHGYTDMG